MITKIFLKAGGAINFTEENFIKLFKDKKSLIDMGKKAERCVNEFGGASEDIFNIIKDIK